jgi:hypothetical protein
MLFSNYIMSSPLYPEVLYSYQNSTVAEHSNHVFVVECFSYYYLSCDTSQVNETRQTKVSRDLDYVTVYIRM